MTDADKVKYQKKAEDDKARYEREKAKYNVSSFSTDLAQHN